MRKIGFLALGAIISSAPCLLAQEAGFQRPRDTFDHKGRLVSRVVSGPDRTIRVTTNRFAPEGEQPIERIEEEIDPAGGSIGRTVARFDSGGEVIERSSSAVANSGGDSWAPGGPAAVSPAAAVIRVPADQPTIMGGITAANAGDIVLVAPGTYFENIDFQGKAIIVASSGGAQITIIDGHHLAPVATFRTGEPATAVLSGFTLQNGTSTFESQYEGGGIYVAGSSPTIVGNIIMNNTACSTGGGIGISGGAPLIASNILAGNTQSGCSGGPGGGAISALGSSPLILGNFIFNNAWPSGDGGGITLFAAATPLVHSNVITGNVASGVSPASEGGGIWIVNDSRALIAQNLIFNNTAGQGAGISATVPQGTPGPTFVNNTMVGNNATQLRGSAVFISGFDDGVRFFNNLLIGRPGQSAVFCDGLFSSVPPMFTTNDAFSPGASPMQGTCAGQLTNFGNISADPLFANPAVNDYHLQAGSRAIDAGTNLAFAARDLGGQPRIVDGNGDGNAIIDMGVFERP